MQRDAAQAVDHLDAERRKRRTVVRLPVEQTYGLFQKGREGLLGGEIGFVARYGGPEEHGYVDGVVAGRAAHQSQLRADVVADAFQLAFVLRPCHDVAMAAHAAQALRMRFIEVEVDPLLVERIGARVARQGVHVACRRFQPFEGLVVVVQKDHLVVDVVARQQKSHGSREREAAVGALRREPFVASVGGRGLRHRIQIGERIERESFVAYAHLSGIEPEVFVDDLRRVAECEVAGHEARVLRRTDEPLGREPFQLHDAAVVQDTLHLPCGVQKTRDGLPVPHPLRNEEAPAERAVGARLTHPLGCGERNEKVTRVVEERPLVEMPLEGPREEAAFLHLGIGDVPLLHEPVLLVHDRMVGQHFEGLDPCGM